MTRVRFTDDGPATYRVAGVSFEPGDTHDVSDGLAEHLVDGVGFFEYAEATGVEFTEVEADGEIDTDTVEEIGDAVIEQRIDAGECPWCDEYEGDAVGQHAASAHPDYWDAYKED